ncbi:hypothetical protein PR048_025945 [Dryococelus australis]|uniref:Uncharacterized protein n=1 Tax=Dryococelus australis TaxID=614101 RepID=A0ABQ9GJY6_9NEOP|nr:hypothetical protein PR048_025945 [Dryococelus australis]
MEQHRNARTGETGDHREIPLTSGIVRHDSYMWKSGGWPRRNLNPVRLVHGYRIASDISIHRTVLLRATRCERVSDAASARNRIRLERATQQQSSDTHKTPHARVKRCRERKINIKASERVNFKVLRGSSSFSDWLKHVLVRVNGLRTDREGRVPELRNLGWLVEMCGVVITRNSRRLRRVTAAVLKWLDCSPPTQGEPGSIPGGVASGSSHLGIVPQTVQLVRRVVSGISRFSPPSHSSAAPYSPGLTLIGSRELDVLKYILPLVPTVFDTSRRRLVQLSSSTVTADNQCAFDICIFVHTTVESTLHVVELANVLGSLLITVTKAPTRLPVRIHQVRRQG